MISIKSSIVIQRSPEEVFHYIANFENNPTWQGGMVDAHFTSEGSLREGSTYDQVATFLGKEIRTSFVVTQYIPLHKIQIKSIKSTFPITVTRVVELVEDGAEVTAFVEGNPGNLFKLAKPLMKKMVQKSVTNDYRNLKKLLEK
ncbi:SRPBCC family protein [Guptibacillus hwajinpoensis]|uniref:Membrane protein n=1 Tax=Guptibacillus hwajinpoensis TaxID=208199 RepID=A0ABU0K630_9BACL|nr:SRPBCC family protein [Alkalihalobacillus hemicentroti]MDQ0484821.1 putative membrane protein [Alkalihalobacillus hemicentroti]